MRVRLLVLAAFLLVCAGARAEMKPVTVTTPDGLAIAAFDGGASGAPGILFIHGFAQSALSWDRQANSDLARRFHLVTYDIRGHGASSKPSDPAFYKEGRRWAEEVRAVMAATGLIRPVLVAWSYGGRVVADYLAAFGDADLAGIVFVDASMKGDPALFGPAVRELAGMNSTDLATNIRATRAFLRACFAVQPSQDEFETMLAFNMVQPPIVRVGLGGRPAAFDAILGAVKVPTLVLHGAEDAVVRPAMGQYTAGAVPGAKLVMIEGAGHAPFWEKPERINAELAAFVEGLR